jgi:transcriptional regulator with XRE-family HTH domain
LNTIGDHIKKIRLDRGLRQRDVAKIIGVDPFTILNWETGATNTKFRYLPAINRFLGDNPCPVPPDSPLGVWLKARRHQMGLSLKRLAKRLHLNDSTIRKLEAGRHKKPTQETLRKIFGFLQST